MTDLITVPQAAHWQRLKALVLDSVSSPITRRVYNLGLDEFFEWFGREPRSGFNKATVSTWRVALEARGLGSILSTCASQECANWPSRLPTTDYSHRNWRPGSRALR